jgi:hypothetical protein
MPTTRITKKDRLSKAVPFYDDKSKLTILRFLAAYLSHAENAHAAEIKMAGEQRHLPLFAGRINYWRHVQGAIKWLAARVHDRQRHLVELSDEEVAEIIARMPLD